MRQGARATTWSDLADRVARLAGALRTLGLAPGERVAVLSTNNDAFFALLTAVPWAGGVLVPLNTRLAEPELLACLEDSGSRLLLAEDDHLPLARELADQASCVERALRLDASDHVAGDAANSPAVAARRSSPPADQGRGDEDAAVLCYTGGTTGRPKGVVLTHRSIVTSCLQWQGVARLSADDCLLLVAPMFHLAGLTNSYGAMLVGGTAEILERFDPQQVLETIETRQVSYAVLVPAMIRALVRHPDITRRDVSCLARITYGGSPISESELREALTYLPDTAFVQIYGQTEAGITAALMPEDHVVGRKRLRSAGRPLPGVEVRILDADGDSAPPGTWGEICTRSPGLAQGYWNRPAENAETFRDGWLHTGDIGYLDDEGFLYVVDRAKDMIISGGENVYSVEVEQVLDAHPAVAESAVVAVPSERWGEAVHAVVRLKDGAAASTDALIAHCREHLAGYKCPRGVTFRSTPLPRNPIGKILKRELRRTLREDEAC